MNRAQRRAAKRNNSRKIKLPAHELNRQRAKPSAYAAQQYLSARITAANAADAPPDEDHRESVLQRNEQLVHDAIYCRDIDHTAALLSQVVLETELIVCFYDDLPEAKPYLAQIQQARAALEQEKELRDGSPNQRRALLAPLRELSYSLYGLMGITPTSMLHILSGYIERLRIRWAHYRYCDSGVKTCAATHRIIRGESLRTLAKEYGIKENLLKAQVLAAAKELYAIGLLFQQLKTIQPANAIPELRTEEYQTVTAMLRSIALTAFDECENFEKHFGIGASSEVSKAERRLAETTRKLH